MGAEGRAAVGCCTTTAHPVARTRVRKADTGRDDMPNTVADRVVGALR
jgi:hypothetical protein